MTQKKPSLLVLLPMVVFLVLFLGTGLYLQSIGTEYAFYQLPTPVAALVGIVIAFILYKGTLEDKVQSFIRGAGDSNIVIMCMIYLLAGAFVAVADGMGGVESTVKLGLSIIPAKFIIPGLFVIAAFISTAMGTSMGTIGAVTPIAVGMAAQVGIPLPYAVGAVVGGAMFGDNLSMISDTTIAATRTQGAELKDKFKTNFFIALPAALLTIIAYTFVGGASLVSESYSYDLLKVMPYLLVLILALLGMNVFVVLTLGIVSAGLIGLYGGQFANLLSLAGVIYKGFTSMQEIFLLSMLTGGLAEMMRQAGGVDYLLNAINKKIKSRRGAELGIGALVSATDICTANNTVAIILAGPMAKEIAGKYAVSPARAASILDIFSCVWQGLIPYGAQILLAGSIAKLSPVVILPTLWYQFLLGVFVIGAIILATRKKANVPSSQSVN